MNLAYIEIGKADAVGSRLAILPADADIRSYHFFELLME